MVRCTGMYSYTNMTYAGHTIYIIKVLADVDHNVQLLVMAYKYYIYNFIKLVSDFRNPYLEINEW